MNIAKGGRLGWRVFSQDGSWPRVAMLRSHQDTLFPARISVPGNSLLPLVKRRLNYYEEIRLLEDELGRVVEEQWKMWRPEGVKC